MEIQCSRINFGTFSNTQHIPVQTYQILFNILFHNTNVSYI